MKSENKKNKWIVLLNVVLGTFMATLDGSIVNVALPSISKGLYVSITTVQWVVTSYLITISALLLVFGKLSDIYGRKILYFSGYSIFSIGSLLCGIATNIWFIVFARIIQALGAAILMSISQAIISDTFPVEERGRALGISGTVVALGNLTGPSLGGILTGVFGWQSIFLINIPIGIIGAIMSLKVLSNKKKDDVEKFDYFGSLVFALSIVLLFAGALDMTISLICTSIPVMLLFLFIESRQEYPIIDVSIFKIKLFGMGLLSAFLSFVAMNSVIIIMPFYLQGVMGLLPAQAGIVLMAFPLAMAVSAPISGSISDRIGYQLPTIMGLSLAVVSYIGLTFLEIDTSIIYIYLMLIIMGIGLGIFQSPNNSSIMSSVPKNRLGIAASVNALVRNIGMVTGITLAMAVYTYMMRKQGLPEDLEFIANPIGFVRSMKTIYTCSSIVAALGLIVALTRIRNN